MGANAIATQDLSLPHIVAIRRCKMKLSSVVLAATACSASGQHATGATQVNDKNHIERLNSVAGSGWVAGANEFFEGLTFDQARSVLGTALSHISEHLHSVRNQSAYD